MRLLLRAMAAAMWPEWFSIFPPIVNRDTGRSQAKCKYYSMSTYDDDSLIGPFRQTDDLFCEIKRRQESSRCK